MLKSGRNGLAPFPHKPKTNGSSVGRCDTEELTELSVCDRARRMDTPHLNHVIVAEFSQMVLASKYASWPRARVERKRLCSLVSAFSNLVRGVYYRCASKQMKRTDAGWSVAAMANSAAPTRKLAVSNEPRETVSGFVRIGYFESSITILMLATSPEPAVAEPRVVRVNRAVSVDLGPKACNRFVIHELTPYGSDAGGYNARRRFVLSEGV